MARPWKNNATLGYVAAFILLRRMLSDDTAAASPNDTQVVASGTAAPFIPAEAFQKTPEEEAREHPKGCGCAVPGRDGSGMPLLGVLPFTIVAAVSRRKRASRRTA